MRSNVLIICLAGIKFSDQANCPALTEPPGIVGVYDVSACASVAETGACTVSCLAGWSGNPSTGTCSCSVPQRMACSWPTCLQTALAPTFLTASGLSTDSVKLTWLVNSLRGCKERGDFTHWNVQQSSTSATSGFSGAGGGCSSGSLTCETATECTASVPSANTQYFFKVSAVCASSLGSADSVVVSALSHHTPAAKPTGSASASASVTESTVTISWTANAANGCTFSHWDVNVRSPTSTWYNKPLGCEDLGAVATTSCTLRELACNTNYMWKVTRKCSNAAADSPASDQISISTAETLTCLKEASPPTNVVFQSLLSYSSATISWKPGSANDCIFYLWEVKMWAILLPTTSLPAEGVDGELTDVPGCTSLFDRSVNSCTATDLTAKYYRVTVREVCTKLYLSSAFSAASVVAAKQLQRALAPTSVVLSNPQTTSLKISWSAQSLNDCVFKQWKVSIHATVWTSYPTGCAAPRQFCIQECTAVGLTSNTLYKAKVMAICEETTAAAGSFDSAESATMRTALIPAPMLTGLVAQGTSSTATILQWSPVAASPDCVFVSWVVEIKRSDSPAWYVPYGCDNIQMGQRLTASCTAYQLPSGTTFTARGRETCTNSDADAPYRYSVAFTTTGTGAQSAQPPNYISADNPTATSLFISFAPGSPMDCIFNSFEVQYKRVSATGWVSACANILVRTNPTCTVTNLLANTAYYFKAREICTQPSLNSAYVTSQLSFKTLPLSAVTIADQFPSGILTESPPTLFMAIFSTPMMIASTELEATFWATGCQNLVSSSQVTLWQGDPFTDVATEMNFYCSAVENGGANAFQREFCCGANNDCSPTCALQTAMSRGVEFCPTDDDGNGYCSCSGAACASQCVQVPFISQTQGMSLLDNQVLQWNFPTGFLIRPLCTYKIYIATGFVRTVAYPAAFLSGYSWTFVYKPSAPDLTGMSLVSSSTSMLAFDVTWTEATTFSCVTIPNNVNSGNLEYTGVGAVRMYLTGLTSGTGYQVQCTGTASTNTVVSGTRSRGTFFTDDDTDAKLASLTVTAARVCLDPTYSGAVTPVLSPYFDPATTGGTYAVSVDVSQFRTGCRLTTTGDAMTFHTVTFQATPSSPHATVVYDPPSAKVGLLLDWPDGQLPSSVSQTVTIQVWPKTGGKQSAATYQLTVSAAYQAFVVQNIAAANTKSNGELQYLPLDGTVGVTVDVFVPDTYLSQAVQLSDVSVLFGSHVQTSTSSTPTTGVTLAGTGKTGKTTTLTVAGATGYGVDLPVLIRWAPTGGTAQSFESPYYVSFMPPVIERARMEVGAGNLQPYASTISATTVKVLGFSLGISDAATANKAQIHITSQHVNATLPLLMLLTFDATYQSNFGDSYKMRPPLLPLLIKHESLYKSVCNLSVTSWVLNDKGVLCWSFLQRWMHYFVNAATGSPVAYGEILCGQQWQNPLTCNTPSTSLWLRAVADGAPELRPIVNLDLAFANTHSALSGTYTLSLPGDTIWATNGHTYTTCDDTKHKWIIGNAVFCWISAGGKWSLLTSSGAAAVEVGFLACSPYNVDPKACGTAYSGALLGIQVTSRRLVDRKLWGNTATDGYPNLCGPTTFINVNQLSCVLPATLDHPIYLELAILTGSGIYAVAARANHLNSNQKVMLQPPELASINQPLQPVSATLPFTVKGQYFPEDSLTMGNLQLWASAESSITVPPNPSTHAPLCSQMIRSDSTEARCDRYTNWDAAVIRTTRPNVWMQVSPTLFSATPLSNVLQIPQMVIAQVNRSDDYEVPTVRCTIIGSGFGSLFGSKLVVHIISAGKDSLPIGGGGLSSTSSITDIAIPRNTSCTVLQRSDTQLICDVQTKSLLYEDLDDPAYKSGALITYQAWLRLRFEFTQLTTSTGQLLEAIYPIQVSLFTCPPGHYRATKSSRTCWPCEYGRHSTGNFAIIECNCCPLGRYANFRKTQVCSECVGDDYSTMQTCSIWRTQCLCAPGYERDRRYTSNSGPYETGVCMPCPKHAWCDGGKNRSYSKAGYWTPNQYVWWKCSPMKACLRGTPRSPNICAPGRYQKSRRCGECDEDYYRYRGECFKCESWFRIFAIAAPAGIGALLVLIVIPCFIGSNTRKNAITKVLRERDDESETDSDLDVQNSVSNSVSNQSSKPKEPDADVVPVRGRQKATKIKVQRGPCGRCCRKCRKRNPLRRLSPDHWPRLLQEVVTRPRTRMFMFMVSRMQLVWCLILVPVEWPDSVHFLREYVLSVFVFDLDAMRPECLIPRFHYFWKFLSQWAGPFIVLLIITFALWTQAIRFRNADHPNHIHFKSALYEVISFLVCVLTVSHVADDLNFLRCEPCEINRMCLVDYASWVCHYDENWWLTMAIISIIDLAIVVLPCNVFVMFAIYKSWCWQHGAGSGLDRQGNKLWHIAVAEIWVKDYKGYSATLRKDSVHLREYMRKVLHYGLDTHSVWERCVFRGKMTRWRLTEQKVDGQIYDIIDAATKFRKIKDAQVMHAKDDAAHTESNRCCTYLCALFCKYLCLSLRCHCVRRKKRNNKFQKLKGCLGRQRRCCDCIKRCVRGGCRGVCGIITACCRAPKLIPKRVVPRHMRENPYQTKRQKPDDSQSPQSFQPDVQWTPSGELTYQDYASEAQRINEQVALRKLKAAKIKKYRDLKKTMRLLRSTEEFVKENDLGSGICFSASMFWTYSWEFTLLWQKLLVIIVSTFAPRQGISQESIISCLFFQLMVMVVQIDIEPFEWNILNDLSQLADILTFYFILSAQLKWDWSIIIIGYSICGVVAVPCLLRMCFPSVRAGKMFDDDGHVVDAPSKPRSFVELAIFEEALGVNGMRLFKRAQKRWRRKYAWKLKNPKSKKEEFAEYRKAALEREREKRLLKEKFGVRAALVDGLENLPQALKGPVQTVLKVGWGKVNWPSKFSAVHLAANLGSKDGIQILAEAKANLTGEDVWRHTPLDYAEAGGYQDVIDLIFKLAPDAYHSVPVDKSSEEAKGFAANGQADKPVSNQLSAKAKRGAAPKQLSNNADHSGALSGSGNPKAYGRPKKKNMGNQLSPPSAGALPPAKPGTTASDDEGRPLITTKYSQASGPPARPKPVAQNAGGRANSANRAPPTRAAAQGGPTVKRMSMWNDQNADGHVARNLLGHEAQEQGVNPEIRQRRRPASRGRKAAAAANAAAPSAAVHNF